MIGQISAQIALPLELEEPAPAYVTVASPCCPAPYCSGCVVTNHLSEEDTAIMRRHLVRLRARSGGNS